jgi:hypothetical protein
MRLCCAARQGREDWFRQIQYVEQECIHQRERCPVQGELDAATAECAATELLKMIENYYTTNCHSVHTPGEKYLSYASVVAFCKLCCHLD